MKKIISFIILVCMLLLAFSACTAKDDSEKQYEDAMSLIEQKEYQAAYDILVKMEDSEKAQELLSHFYYVPTNATLSDRGQLITNTYLFDDAGRPCKGVTSVKSDAYNVDAEVELVYDNNGRVTAIISSDKNDSNNMVKNEYFYNDQNRLIKEQYTDSKRIVVLEYDYDNNGNLIKESRTEDAGEPTITEYTYDEKGNCTKKAEKTQGIVIYVDEYTYDENGNLLNEIHSYVYDDQFNGELYDENGNPLNNVVVYPGYGGSDWEYSYSYDDNGNLIKEIRTNGYGTSITEYVCDDKGNCIKRTYTSGDSIAYVSEMTYDANGNLITEIVDNTDGEDETANWTYDSQGNMIKEIWSRGDRTTSREWTYDAYGNITKYVYTNGDSVSYVEASSFILVYFPVEVPPYFAQTIDVSQLIDFIQ